MPDQMRGDCLSLARHPVLQTPNIDAIGAQGAHFASAYTTCPSCIPARRAMMTGQHPATNGVTGYIENIPIQSPTLPQLLAAGGYHTVLVGRSMHQSPESEPYGFAKRITGSVFMVDDYSKALDQAYPGAGGVRSIGLSFNGWTARPWPFEEQYHPTTWVNTQSRRYLHELTDDAPLFMISSHFAPHPPLFPPACYYDRYANMTDRPKPAIGDWAVRPENDGLGLHIDSQQCVLQGERLRMAQAGYFGLIHHLDDQVYWLIEQFRRRALKRGRPYLIIFTSDHGEMLGDHYYFRKCEPFEGSAHIPLLIDACDELNFKRGLTIDSPVCLEDLMPTLLDLAGLPVPRNIDGRSLVPVLRGQSVGVRDILHGEHSPCYSEEQSNHYLTDGRSKYIWRPHSGRELLFDLQNDPLELHDLSSDADRIAPWRQALIARLKDRPEGFTDGRRLIPGRPYPGQV